MLVRSTLVLVLGAFIASTSNAAELYIYPNEGQSADQQKQDEFDCYHFGRDRTGFDPMVIPTATSAKPQNTGPSTGQRLLRGAALGGAIGAITGNSSDAKKYAGAGAATGALMGGAKKRDTQKQQKQWEQEQQQIYAQSRNEYNRAYAACMEGRNYTVR